jgi:hypothetical protein
MKIEKYKKFEWFELIAEKLEKNDMFIEQKF